MAGIIFLGTKNPETIRKFYIDEIGMELWLEQAECFILKHGNLLLGFCKRKETDIQGIITFFFDTNEEVDLFYRKFKDTSEGAPKINEMYHIYHFFARDPENRRIEFQRFNHILPPI